MPRRAAADATRHYAFIIFRLPLRHFTLFATVYAVLPPPLYADATLMPLPLRAADAFAIILLFSFLSILVDIFILPLLALHIIIYTYALHIH
jgi:hypothetical protein